MKSLVAIHAWACGVIYVSFPVPKKGSGSASTPPHLRTHPPSMEGYRSLGESCEYACADFDGQGLSMSGVAAEPCIEDGARALVAGLEWHQGLWEI